MLTIRPARPEDEAALLPIHLATWTADVSPGATPDPADPFFEEGVRLSDVLVAVEDDAVVGYVRLEQLGPFPSHERVLEINGLAVAPDRQGDGLGRVLIEAALDEARARDAPKVTLKVLSTNARARRLYESCGFSTEGVLRREYLLRDELVDDVLMALHLDDDGAA